MQSASSWEKWREIWFGNDFKFWEYVERDGPLKGVYSHLWPIWKVVLTPTLFWMCIKSFLELAKPTSNKNIKNYLCINGSICFYFFPIRLSFSPSLNANQYKQRKPSFCNVFIMAFLSCNELKVQVQSLLFLFSSYYHACTWVYAGFNSVEQPGIKLSAFVN